MTVDLAAANLVTAELPAPDVLGRPSVQHYVDLTPQQRDALMAAARDERPVTGLTHNHYRYPARFSPVFVRAAIEAFTGPGDLVLDPFVGGGTSVVEAAALGRAAVGVDISSLATFVTEAKTLLLEPGDVTELLQWRLAVTEAINMRQPAQRAGEWMASGYHRNIGRPRFWRLRKAIEQAIASAAELSPRSEMLARCAILRTAQWALDARRVLPTITSFRDALKSSAEALLAAALEYREAVSRFDQRNSLVIMQRSAAGLENEQSCRCLGAPKLVLTSPPYPGIHVLYHRWQVDGRKETPAPFWIANRLDGSGEAYYSMGSRRAVELKTYYSSLCEALTSTAALSDEDTTFVQVVAFSDPSWQLERYLAVAEEAGLVELRLEGLDTIDGRLWRRVPNRRWHADQKGALSASKEVVLFHRLKRC